jgi:hypothetical protein
MVFGVLWLLSFSLVIDLGFVEENISSCISEVWIYR